MNGIIDLGLNKYVIALFFLKNECNVSRPGQTIRACWGFSAGGKNEGFFRQFLRF